jgi:hypothetical protein
VNIYDVHADEYAVITTARAQKTKWLLSQAGQTTWEHSVGGIEFMVFGASMTIERDIGR